MTQSIIVAKAENHVSGKDTQLPWYMPQDLQHFKRTTMGHHVVRSRKNL